MRHGTLGRIRHVMAVIGQERTYAVLSPKRPVRAREDRLRDLESERLSVPQAYDELELGRLRDGEIPRFGAVEDLVQSKMSADELTRRSIQEWHRQDCKSGMS